MLYEIFSMVLVAFLLIYSVVMTNRCIQMYFDGVHDRRPQPVRHRETTKETPVDILMSNLEAYDGTDNGQREI